MDMDFVSVLLVGKPGHRVIHAQSNREANLWLRVTQITLKSEPSPADQDLHITRKM